MTVADTERRTDRFVGVDAARGLALLGMVAVHVVSSITSDFEVSWSSELFGGRSSALFAVVAGVGLALATGARTPPQGRAWTRAAVGVLTRALVIGAVGLLLGPLGSGVAVILAYYAVLFALGVVFLSLRTGPLLVLGGLWIVLSPVISQWWRAGLPAPTLEVPGPEHLLTPGALFIELLVTGYYPAFTWLGYLLVGMALGRADLGRRGLQIGLLVGGTALAVVTTVVSDLLMRTRGLDAVLQAGAGGAALNGGDIEISLETSLYGTTPTTSWWWLASDGPHSGTPFDLAHTTGTALAALGLMLLIARSPLGVRVLEPLWAPGRMTFTLYTAHVLLLAVFGADDEPTVLVIHVVALVAFGVLWTRLVGRGPMERLAHAASTGARALVPR